MIKVTLKQLVEAAQSGAYQRFTAIRKTITAGHKNRKVPAAVQEELKHFDEARKALVEKCGGVLSEDKTHYDFAEKGEEFAKGFEELLAQTVELPGEPIKLADLLDGGLLEADYAMLEPWLGE
jgi:NAD-specific glutamate dehydrogenase